MPSLDLMERLAVVYDVPPDMLKAMLHEAKIGEDGLKRVQAFVLSLDGQQQQYDLLIEGLQIERQALVRQRAEPAAIQEVDTELKELLAEYGEFLGSLKALRALADAQTAKRTPEEQSFLQWVRQQRYTPDQVATLRGVAPEVLQGIVQLAHQAQNQQP